MSFYLTVIYWDILVVVRIIILIISPNLCPYFVVIPMFHHIANEDNHQKN